MALKDSFTAIRFYVAADVYFYTTDNRPLTDLKTCLDFLADTLDTGFTTTMLGLGTVTITYSASMTPDAATGNFQVITATNGSAFTLNAPTNPTTGRFLTFTIRNTSGGALGVATWNAVFKMATWTSPATANSRSITFKYDGTNWVEITRTTTDIPN